jgi:hypothetical protein
MAKFNRKNGKKSLFYEEKSLVGLTPGQAKLGRAYVNNFSFPRTKLRRRVKGV